jgi:hypothetical protein
MVIVIICWRFTASRAGNCILDDCYLRYLHEHSYIAFYKLLNHFITFYIAYNTMLV